MIGRFTKMYALFLCYILIFSIFDNATIASNCDKIKDKYSPKGQYVSIEGVKKSVHLYWGSDPARAASALFKTIINYTLGYQMVELHEGPHNLQRLVNSIHHTVYREYSEVILALSTGWEPMIRQEFGSYGNLSGLAGPRLQELGASQVPARQQLFLYLAANYQHVKICARITEWIFYTNKRVLAECGFINTNASNSVDKATVYWLDTNNVTIKSKLEERVKLSQFFKFHNIRRDYLFHLLESSHTSFFFLDYDIWEQHPKVEKVQTPPYIPGNNYSCEQELDTSISMRVADVYELEVFAYQLLQLAQKCDIWEQYSKVEKVQTPPCIPGNNYACEQELDTSISMRVADVYDLEVFAYQLLQLAQIYQPSLDSLRRILYLEGIRNYSIEDAACEWALKNYDKVDYWVQKYNNLTRNYEVIFFYCRDDPYFKDYDKLLEHVSSYIENEIPHSKIAVRRYPANCSDVNYVKNKIEHYMSLSLKQRLLGAVVDGRHILDIAKKVDRSSLPIFFYNAPALKSTESIWLSTGRSLHLALALQSFIFDMKWKRFAILSERSKTVHSFTKEIEYLQSVNRNSNYTFRIHKVEYQLSASDAEDVLKILKEIEEARIIFIDTNYEDTVTILNAAETLKMTEFKDYVWIVREWQPNKAIVNIQPLTISFWCRSSENVPRNQGRRDWIADLDELGKKSTFQLWPAKATALVDAVITMVHGFREVFDEYPETQNDVHSKFTIRQFKEKIEGVSINGTIYNLIYKDSSIEKTIVFLEQWHGNQPILLRRWIVNSTEKSVIADYHQHDDKYFKNRQVYDGSTSCLLTSGDKYLPDCHYVELAIGLLLVIISPPALVLLYRAVQSHEKKRAHMIMLDLLMQRQQNAAIISDHLVDRSALIIKHELGTGRFGSVRLAQLRLPGRMSRVVAAKSLREGQDERELVREASILAPLVHNHIIRLIGVCIDDKPTLLLMEYALFGDLLHYLQERWYLAEGVISTSGEDSHIGSEEAVYVSARALTRMAREAASALAYLSLYGVVHRDIRAANFLVDGNRSLKLADFGLARKTTTKGTDGSMEYISIKRMFLPVRAMAPECLNQGTFSTSSDVWALGVLVFELVTLGGCAYGNMSLQNIASFIMRGGHPPLPHDATPHTIALTRLCWQYNPESRPTAAEVVAYLAERPCALQPALQFDNSTPDSPESVDSAHPLLV